MPRGTVNKDLGRETDRAMVEILRSRDPFYSDDKDYIDRQLEAAISILTSLLEERTTPKFRAGEHCRIFRENGEPRVQHYDCDEHPDGYITNPITGQVIRTPGLA